MVLTCWAFSFLDGTPLEYLYKLIHRRGLAPYPILWIGFSVAGATIWALRKQESRRKVAKVLLTFAALPLVIGGFGTYMRLIQTRQVCAAFLKYSESASDPTQLEGLRAAGTRMAWDNTKLAVLVSIICFALALHLWMRIEDRKDA